MASEKRMQIYQNTFFLHVRWSGVNMLGQKRKLASKTITEKYKILKEIDKGNSCAFVAKKHNVPKQTLSNWLKKKKQIYESVNKNNEKTSTI